MKSPSSISSSEPTGELPPGDAPPGDASRVGTFHPHGLFKVPRAILVALVLLICAEGVARYGVSKGKFKVGSTGQSVIEKHVDELKAKKPEIWLLGNSMLDAGIDQDKFSAGVGQKAVKLPMGSATVRASAALLSRYFRDVPTKPKKVMLFISPDDLNLSGNREAVSNEIKKKAKGQRKPPQEYSMLYMARGSIVSRVTSRFSAATSGDPAAEGETADGTFKPLPVTAANYPGYNWLVGLVKEYKMDDSAISVFASTAHEAGITDVSIVIMPTTDLFQGFHDGINPTVSYKSIRDRIADECRKAGIAFIDHGDAMTQYKLFRDLYHLTKEEGRVVYTARIVAEVLAKPVTQPSSLPTTAPATRP